jgi:hypothetical protein
MPHEEPAAHDAAAQDTAVQAQQATAYEPSYEPTEEDEAWLEEPEELPRRPRRRLLSPIPLALLAALLTAGGFIGGVLVEKGQSASTSSAGAGTGLASRLAGLRGGGSGATAVGAAGGGGSGAAGAGGAGATGGGQRPTAGQVAYINGTTLYLTNAEGNTVKVTTSAGTSVNKTVKASVSGIHPGETVTVTGSSGASGVISAESINVGSGAGGLGALLGGLGAGSGSGAGKGTSGGGGGEQALFGKGG